MQKLNDTLCVVTGGARGIGKAVCAAFVEQGARVILTDIDTANGTAAAAELDCDFASLDVAREADWDSFAASHPEIDVLVNNAGITGFEDSPSPHDPENAKLADWHRVHAVNTDGCFLGCRYALRAMKAKGEGSIVNISSRSAMVGIPGAAAYAASKAAIRNHTKSVALYAAQQGWRIRCNSVHPAAILTSMWEPMLGEGPEREARMASLVAETPLQRFGTAEEVAALCVFLAGPESAYMTGAELTVDGGLLAGSAATPR